MKPSEIKAELRKLGDTPGLAFTPAERSQYFTPEQIAACDRAEKRIEHLNAMQRKHITRVAAKLKRLQTHLIEKKRGEEYARFRFCADNSPVDPEQYPASGYQQPGFPVGGVYQQPEDEREAFIDAKLKLEGLD